eukprot:15159690-Alexandrium_andersonii.AAC.1
MSELPPPPPGVFRAARARRLGGGQVREGNPPTRQAHNLLLASFCQRPSPSTGTSKFGISKKTRIYDNLPVQAASRFREML